MAISPGPTIRATVAIDTAVLALLDKPVYHVLGIALTGGMLALLIVRAVSVDGDSG